MHVVVLIDPEAVLPSDPQFETAAEHAVTEVEYHVTETLRDAGHEARVVPFGPDLAATAARLRDPPPDLVFNLTEHYGGNRRMDMHIVAFLEMLGVPYTGTGPEGMMLCRDKGLCKRLLLHHRVRVPDFVILPPGRLRVPRALSYPAVVKPALEDGSDGISRASLVRSEEELRQRAGQLHERMGQPVICEEFIPGRELYVTLLGNRRLLVLPAREVRFGRTADDGGPLIATARVKRDPAYREKWGIRYEDALLDADTNARLARLCRRIFRVLQVRDYARIDVRLREDGEAVFLEANANPDLTMGDEVSESAVRAGLSYDALIARLVRTALRRCRGG